MESLSSLHGERGLISCVANNEFSTLGFNPTFNLKVHSTSGNRDAIRVKPVTKPPFYFVDSVGVASSIPIPCVLPILKVARALKYIVEYHDFPGFMRWSDATSEQS